ncbi:SitI3 family protein [Actinoplanes sp. HUAS TT8]|uniref:SitI3 family protein n=1 Tax=Actinoplanes sp. HUAS TT8 TaxID=3447453 RepID=UPI003F528B5E
MALEYRLHVANPASVREVAARAFPEPDERPVGTPPLLTADLNEKYGFGVTLYAGQDGYIEADSGDGIWEWEPADFVRITFHMRKDGELFSPLAAMIAAVKRVLDSGSEDVSLDFNGNWLILTRIDGVVTRHRQADWWDIYRLS